MFFSFIFGLQKYGLFVKRQNFIQKNVYCSIVTIALLLSLFHCF